MQGPIAKVELQQLTLGRRINSKQGLQNRSKWLTLPVRLKGLHITWRNVPNREKRSRGKRKSSGSTQDSQKFVARLSGLLFGLVPSLPVLIEDFQLLHEVSIAFCLPTTKKLGVKSKMPAWYKSLYDISVIPTRLISSTFAIEGIWRHNVTIMILCLFHTNACFLSIIVYFMSAVLHDILCPTMRVWNLSSYRTLTFQRHERKPLVSGERNVNWAGKIYNQ